MPAPNSFVAVCENIETASAAPIPVLVGRDNARYRGPVMLEVIRSGKVGGLTVWGANLSEVNSANRQEFKGSDGATGRTVFDTNIAHAAFSNFNWLVLVNGVILDQGAGAGKFQESNNGGYGRITLGTAANIGDKVEVFFVTPVSLLTFATATTYAKKTEVAGKEVVWAAIDATATPSASSVYLLPTGG